MPTHQEVIEGLVARAEAAERERDQALILYEGAYRMAKEREAEAAAMRAVVEAALALLTRPYGLLQLERLREALAAFDGGGQPPAGEQGR